MVKKAVKVTLTLTAGVGEGRGQVLAERVSASSGEALEERLR